MVNNKTCSNCGVPEKLHNTACGWGNANIILFEGEETFNGATSAEEREIRWLISQSDNYKKLQSWFLTVNGYLTVRL